MDRTKIPIIWKAREREREREREVASAELDAPVSCRFCCCCCFHLAPKKTEMKTKPKANRALTFTRPIESGEEINKKKEKKTESIGTGAPPPPPKKKRIKSCETPGLTFHLRTDRDCGGVGGKRGQPSNGRRDIGAP